MIGSRLGRYEIVEEIGKGGMGTVFRGVDTSTARAVAIKCLKPELIALDATVVERFEREGEALSRLNHPNIVRVLDTVHQDDQHYLILEYVPGGSLSDLLKREAPLDISRVLGVALELADALTRAHHLRIVHRDLKPANVLLADDGTPRLTDFGVARMARSQKLTETGLIVGTPDYLSPEALTGKELDGRSDLWSFGVLLFEMLAGRRPFEGSNLTVVITGILTQPAADLEALRPDAPVALVDLIYRMLEKDVEARIPSARLVGAELEAVLGGWRAQPGESGGAPAWAARDGLAFSPAAISDSPAPVADVPRYNWPSQTTPFVGRRRELGDLVTLVDDPAARLVTILAPGGMGKTRLALEAAEERSTAFPGGIVFVSLASLQPTDDLMQAIAEALGFHFQGDRPSREQLLDHLRARRTLLVLDGFEHLTESAPLLSEILRAAPAVKIIVTSRERLNLAEEAIFHLEGMRVAESMSADSALEHDAVQLLVQGIRRTQPGFELRGADVEHAVRICRLVEGLPLGLLLAAAWVESLSLGDVAEEIARNLDFLESEVRNVPDRHRSLRAVFESSWNRLSLEERNVFMKLSVFRDGFTREAAQAVTGASLRTLVALVNKCLLRRHRDTGRFQLNELLRHYAQEQLDAHPEAEDAHRAHAAFFGDFMALRWPQLTDRSQKDALLEVMADLENARAAWRHCIRVGDVATAKKFLRTFWVVYDIHGWHPAAIELLEQGAAALRAVDSEDARASLAWVLAAQGLCQVAAAHPGEGHRLAQRSLEILRPLEGRDEMITALISTFVTAAYVNRLDASTEAARECLEVATRVGDEWGIAKATQWLGLMAIEAGDFDEAERLASEALGIFERRGDRWSESVLHIEVLGLLAITRQRYDEAREWIRKGIAAAEEIDFTYSLQVGYFQLGYVAALQEDYVEAGRYWHQATRIGEGIAAYCLFGFAGTSSQLWEDWKGTQHAH